MSSLFCGDRKIFLSAVSRLYSEAFSQEAKTPWMSSQFTFFTFSVAPPSGLPVSKNKIIRIM
jgi:hypothetical protein